MFVHLDDFDQLDRIRDSIELFLELPSQATLVTRMGLLRQAVIAKRASDRDPNAPFPPQPTVSV
jgi:hypothetical protein